MSAYPIFEAMAKNRWLYPRNFCASVRHHFGHNFVYETD